MIQAKAWTYTYVNIPGLARPKTRTELKQPKIQIHLILSYTTITSIENYDSGQASDM